MKLVARELGAAGCLTKSTLTREVIARTVEEAIKRQP
jgi:hypothetical protein